MKNFSLKDETGKIYYGWYIVLNRRYHMWPCLQRDRLGDRGLPSSGYRFAKTAHRRIFILYDDHVPDPNSHFTEYIKISYGEKYKKDHDNCRTFRNYIIHRIRHGKVSDLVLHICCSAGILLWSFHYDAMSDPCIKLVRRKSAW